MSAFLVMCRLGCAIGLAYVISSVGLHYNANWEYWVIFSFFFLYGVANNLQGRRYNQKG